MNKFDYFNWFVEALIERYNEELKVNNSWSWDNDLSKLKILKLLFLSVAENEKALEIFDNFFAWDLWPVEVDIYNKINTFNQLPFTIDNKQTIKKNNKKISEESIEEWKKMVSFLKSKNPKLIKMSASALVDITHEWRCWRVANMLWKLKLSNELILESNKFYWNEYF